MIIYQNKISDLSPKLDQLERDIKSKTHQKQLIEKLTLDKKNLKERYDHSLVLTDDVQNILEILRMSSLSSR